MYNAIAQIIGISGMVLCLLCYHARNRKNLLVTKLAADIIWAIHYFMIGGTAGFTINVLCSIRETVYLIDDNEKHRKTQLIIFVLANWCVQIFTWKGVSSILPAIVATLGSYSFWQKNINVTRIIALLIATCMFTYDLLVMSYAGLISEAMTFVSVLIAIVSNRKNKA